MTRTTERMHIVERLTDYGEDNLFYLSVALLSCGGFTGLTMIFIDANLPSIDSFVLFQILKYLTLSFVVLALFVFCLFILTLAKGIKCDSNV